MLVLIPMKKDMRIKVNPSTKAPRLEIFPGVTGKFLPSSDKVMLVLVEIPSQLVVPPHKHPNEQLGMCLAGKAEFRSGNTVSIVEAGTGYLVPPNVEHSVKVVSDETGVFLDVFTPPREDYLRRLAEED